MSFTVNILKCFFFLYLLALSLGVIFANYPQPSNPDLCLLYFFSLIRCECVAWDNMWHLIDLTVTF